MAAILDAPDDDAPRLVYADWLDEQGDGDRAEFIRLDVRLARTPRSDPGWSGLDRRVAELRQPNFQEWIGRLPQFPGVHWEAFTRGFVSVVKFETPDAYFEYAPDVFTAAPIREVRLHNFYWREASRLADSRSLRRAHVLDLNDGNYIANKGAEALFRSEHLANLSELLIGKNLLGSAGVRAVAEAPYMRGLTRLRVEKNDVYDDGVRFLAESERLTRLRILDVSRTRAGVGGVEALARSRGVRRLLYLDLSGNRITDDAVRVLAASENMTELRTLYLSWNSITDDGVVALAESPQLSRLQNVYLTNNLISDRGAEALARSPYLENVQELYVGGNHISGQAQDQLRARFGSRVNVY
ncbi:MAG TPA: TIGR02996 domain-containing protein [Gemmataceae bacterium]|nr:TIGR02996 domain-containing protein [Gemmataceae bacterium]